MAKVRRRRPPEDREGRMPFGDHLEELRLRVIYVLAGFIAGTGACLFFARDVLRFVCQPAVAIFQINDLPARLQMLSVQEPFTIWLKMGVLAGLVVSTPFTIWQIWRFVALGLYPRERRFVRVTAPTSLALFSVGVLFFHFCVLPIVLHFFIGFGKKFQLGDVRPTWLQQMILRAEPPSAATPATQPALPLWPVLNGDPPDPRPGQVWIDAQTHQIRFATPDGVRHVPSGPAGNKAYLESQFRLNEYVSFVLSLYLAFGLAFQLPIVVIFLGAMDIASVKDMARARRYVIFFIFVAAAILTPPDVVSQMLLGIPMVLLFEGGLLAARFLLRHREPLAAES